MFIDGFCDIRFLCSKMRIKVLDAVYNMEFKNHDFETQVGRHEEKGKDKEGVDKST